MPGKAEGMRHRFPAPRPTGAAAFLLAGLLSAPFVLLALAEIAF